MKMKRVYRPAMAALLLAAMMALLGCSTGAGTLNDGYYTAEAADFDSYGWKEYVTIYVTDNRIITVEYDAKNASGFIKSWDMDYMRAMDAADGTYPNEYTRQYAEAFINRQDPMKVDAITGATTSHDVFQRLAQAAMEQSRRGVKDIAYIDIPLTEAQ